MEDEEKTVTQTDEKTEGAVAGTEEKTDKTEKNKKADKSFSQEEVNAMLKKERSKIPAKEELEAFKKWKEDQKSEEQKKSEQEIEYQKTLTENEDLKKENMLFKKGVINSDDVEFLVYKISKMDGDFEDNVDEFLKENPRYLQFSSDENQDGEKEEKRETTGVKTNNGTATNVDAVEAILRSRHPELYKD